MHFTLAAVLLFATPSDVEIAKALRNLTQMHAIAAAQDVLRAAGTRLPTDVPIDPWGTPYRIEATGRIVSAGSDGRFEVGELANEQFPGTEGDAVFANGAMYRSNRNWLYERAKSGEAAAALEELRAAEMQFMMMRSPAMQSLTLARLTVQAMTRPSAHVDAWGTALRFDGGRVISAGADKSFDPTSWGRPATIDLGEDIIVEQGKVTRAIDVEAYLREHKPVVVPVPQPTDRPLIGDKRITARPVGGDVKAPVVVERVEPLYPESYRRARISGIVILQCVILRSGAIENVRVVKSRAPELDMAGVEAVRQWKFRPGTLDGQPTDVIFNLTINFVLK